MLKHKGTVELSTGRIRLRRYELSDAKNMFRNYASEEETTKYLSWVPYENVEEVKEFLKSCIEEYAFKDVYHWAIEYESEIIGSISAMRIDEKNESVELGYCIGSSYWNRGITTEAVQLVIRFLFQEVGVHRIMAKHDVDNPASGKVMMKNNMTYEGRMKDFYLRHDGTYSDSLIYGIINTDF